MPAAGSSLVVENLSDSKTERGMPVARIAAVMAGCLTVGAGMSLGLRPQTILFRVIVVGTIAGLVVLAAGSVCRVLLREEDE